MRKPYRSKKTKLPPLDPRQLGFEAALLAQAEQLEFHFRHTQRAYQHEPRVELRRELNALDTQIEELHTEIGILTGRRPRRVAS